jgi:potassium/hydrogen antiporter
MSEPFSTALLLVIVSVLMGLAVLLGRTSNRFGIPVMLAFLAVGMLAGEDGPGGIHFSDYHVSFRLGTMALVLILFDGGLSTPLGMVRSGWRPAATLATGGVLAVAGLSCLAARLCGFPWGEAALIGAVVSCTDAAAVFAVLRGQNLRLKRRVARSLELEAGLNDPMAVALTLALTEALIPGKGFSLAHLLLVPLEFVIGAAVGWLVGRAGLWLLRNVPLPAGSLYPVLTLALAGLSFGLPTLAHGSGFLGVYVAALVLGNGELPHRGNLLRVHGALAWIAQVGMFLLLGLLITPTRLVPVALPAAGVALLLAFVTRPAAVALCLAPFGYSLRETLYMGWVGLRGAMPIVLATIPVMAGVPGSETLFHVIFFIVVVGGILPGSTIRWATQILGMGARQRQPPPMSLELSGAKAMGWEIESVVADAAFPHLGRRLDELVLPPRVWIVALIRKDDFIQPRPDLTVLTGDQVFFAWNRKSNSNMAEWLKGGCMEDPSE